MLQIADFGMARDVSDDTYYITRGGKITVKWTAPEVWIFLKINNEFNTVLNRHCFTESIHLKLMCGVLDV